MKKLITVSFLFFLVLFTNCKKEKDVVTEQTVNGMVYNQCTDSGLAGVTVFIKIYKDNSEFNSYQTISGSGGNFSFNCVNIYNSTKYSYALKIPSKSGIGATTIEYCGFIGTTISFTKDESNTFFKPKVIPTFLNLSVFHTYSGSVTNLNDSIQTVFTQLVYHKNIPTLPFSFGGGTYGTIGSSNYSIGNYPMGFWNITIDKWKGGIHTTKNDSIYLGWASSKTYSVNW